LKYCRAGRQRVLPLPDFFIGAHAGIENLFLLTRDVKRFQHYYPRYAFSHSVVNGLLMPPYFAES
jgi:hypothetical protein